MDMISGVLKQGFHTKSFGSMVFPPFVKLFGHIHFTTGGRARGRAKER